MFILMVEPVDALCPMLQALDGDGTLQFHHPKHTHNLMTLDLYR